MASALQILREIIDQAQNLAKPEDVLAHVVKKVASTMNVDVCSIYVFEPKTQVLWLASTQGLNKPDEKVVLKMGQGIVGYIAGNRQIVNLCNAKEHPHFKYIPETNEDKFQAFLGVPIIHLRQLIGVLVAQDSAKRVFDENEEAFLVTLAAHLAGVLKQIILGAGSETIENKEIKGLKGSPGVAVAKMIFTQPLCSLTDIGDQVPGNVGLEIQKFRNAVSDVKVECLKAKSLLKSHTADDIGLLFDVYMMMLDSPSFSEKIELGIKSGNWAPGATRAVILELMEQYKKIEDPYLRTRSEDIWHLGNRLVQRLKHVDYPLRDLSEPVIVVADNMSIQEMAVIPRGKFVGLVCLKGSAFSHTAVLANALGIPSVMGIEKVPVGMSNHGMKGIVDGYRGVVYFDPPGDVIKEYLLIEEQEKIMADQFHSLNDQTALTLDGKYIQMFVNTGLLDDPGPGLKRGAEGVGLYRSEIPFLLHDAFPSEDEQTETYLSVLKAYYPKPVYMRTLDVGGDKILPYFSVSEENPNLGWRGIRFSLDNAGIFLTQIRAMLRASVNLNNLKIMVPMVSNLNEIVEFKKLVEEACCQLLQEGLSVSKPCLGTMVEVPSLLFSIKQLASLVDFISIGSNDLTQYLLAVDRNNARVSGLYEWMDPSVLRAISGAVREAKKFKLKVGLCGEMASDPMSAILLVGMGIESLSMSAFHLPKIKWIIRNITEKEAKTLLNRVLKESHPGQVGGIVHNFMRQKKWTWLIPKTEKS